MAEAKDVDESMVGGIYNSMARDMGNSKISMCGESNFPVIHKLLGSLLLRSDSWTLDQS